MIVVYVLLLNYELLLANYSYMIFVSVGKCYFYLLTVMVIAIMTPQGAHLQGGIFTNLKYLDIVLSSLFLFLLLSLLIILSI